MEELVRYQWHHLKTETAPSPRVTSSMVYDAQHAVCLLFGGGGLNDTWVWDGVTWRQLHPAIIPPARRGGSMVYDAARKRVVLFGGIDNSGVPLNDTWTWDGSDWQQHITAVSPSPRGEASMVYDSARECVVLFAGAGAGRHHTDVLLNDTWTWNGSTWTLYATSISPSIRSGASMAYDSARQATVLFGGSNGVEAFNDTWLWDGIQWISVHTPVSPPERSWANMAYVEASQQVILQGGDGFDKNLHPLALSDTWAWDGSTWTQQTTTTSPSGAFFCYTYNALQQNMVVYAVSGSRPVLGNKKTHTGVPGGGNRPHLTSETWVWASKQ